MRIRVSEENLARFIGGMILMIIAILTIMLFGSGCRSTPEVEVTVSENREVESCRFLHQFARETREHWATEAFLQCLHNLQETQLQQSFGVTPEDLDRLVIMYVRARIENLRPRIDEPADMQEVRRLLEEFNLLPSFSGLTEEESLKLRLIPEAVPDLPPDELKKIK